MRIEEFGRKLVQRDLRKNPTVHKTCDRDCGLLGIGEFGRKLVQRDLRRNPLFTKLVTKIAHLPLWVGEGAPEPTSGHGLRTGLFTKPVTEIVQPASAGGTTAEALQLGKSSARHWLNRDRWHGSGIPGGGCQPKDGVGLFRQARPRFTQRLDVPSFLASALRARALCCPLGIGSHDWARRVGDQRSWSRLVSPKTYLEFRKRNRTSH